MIDDPTKSKNPYFEVPTEMEPGVNRAGYGSFKPGQLFPWPVQAKPGDNPSLKLIPRNEAATALLVKVAKMQVSDKDYKNDAEAKKFLADVKAWEKDNKRKPYHEQFAAPLPLPPEDRNPEGDGEPDEGDGEDPEGEGQTTRTADSN